MLSLDDKKYLLQLARRTLQKYYQQEDILHLNIESLPTSLKKKRGIFVTLTMNSHLRGCIGNILPQKPIYQAVMDNALASAVYDPRFPAVTKTEFPKLKIEISILSPLKKLPQFETKQQLLSYFNEYKPGVLIKKDSKEATFLPQVWEELPNPEDFLQALCQKAGLDSNEWQKLDLKMWEYQVDNFKE